MIRKPSSLFALLLGAVLVCSGGERVAPFDLALAHAARSAPHDDTDASEPDGAGEASLSPEEDKVESTPVAMRIDNVPIPVKGSDGRYHIVYELNLSNFTAAKMVIKKLEVVDTTDSLIVATLDATEIAKRIVLRDFEAVPGTLGAAQTSLLYLHVVFDGRRDMPRALQHRLSVEDISKTVVATAARTRVARATDLVLDAPLRGSRYIAGDGCCDSTRHIRATLALNGGVFTAQRLAIDWEQLDEQDRIYVGDPNNPESYIIYGKPAYAVADAKVIKAVDGMPNSPIGRLPNLPADQADGNHVILALGDGRYALNAHLQRHSVRVHEGEFVRRGQVLGVVGTSGNSSEPHLHFHITDGPTLASNGVPYLLRRFSSRRRGVSTAAFDQAIIDGRPIAAEPVVGPARREEVLPLDLWIVDFPE